jgi:dTDP-4-dehydrorhamnose reductase
MNIAITGANGLVGSRIVELLRDEFTFIPLNHSEVDITDQKQVHKKLNEIDFDLLLHMAAYTNVDKAESEREKAKAINVDGTKYLYEAVQKLGKKMIYISTDFVFDGVTPPFDEMSTPNPVGYYGQTKYEGEQVLGDDAMIVRISYPYNTCHLELDSGSSDIISRLSQLLKDGKSLTMVTDASMTPTYIEDIAQGLHYLIHNYKPEIYHLVGSKSYSPFQVGEMIAKHLGIPIDLIQPTTFEEYRKGKAPRPQYSQIISVKNDFSEMKSLGEMIEYLT